MDSRIKKYAEMIVNYSCEVKPGERVLIESRPSAVFGAVFLVYVMPLVFFLLGYAAGYLAGLPEGKCILCSFLGLAVGAAILVLSQRGKRKKQISYEIVKRL